MIEMILNKLGYEAVGEWTTEKEEIPEIVNDVMSETGAQYYLEDFGEYLVICLTDGDENKEIIIKYEKTGSTYLITSAELA